MKDSLKATKPLHTTTSPGTAANLIIVYSAPIKTRTNALFFDRPDTHSGAMSYEDHGWNHLLGGGHASGHASGWHCNHWMYVIASKLCLDPPTWWNDVVRLRYPLHYMGYNTEGNYICERKPSFKIDTCSQEKTHLKSGPLVLILSSTWWCLPELFWLSSRVTLVYCCVAVPWYLISRSF